MSVRVVISFEAYTRAREEAERHCDRAERYGWNLVGFDGPDRLAGVIGSYRAEEAVAALLGLDGWRRDPNGFKKPDVAGWSVRYGMRPGYGLVIHNRDSATSPYVLVVPSEPIGRAFEVVGWLTRLEAMALKAKGVGRPLPGTTDAWVIPQDRLRGL